MGFLRRLMLSEAAEGKGRCLGSCCSVGRRQIGKVYRWGLVMSDVLWLKRALSFLYNDD